MSSLWQEMGQNARLARPLVALHAGQQAMQLVDAYLLERVSAAALGGAGIGGGLFFAVTVVGIGLLLGLDPLISQAIGAGQPSRARAYLRQGLKLSVLLSLPVAAALALLPLVLGPAGVAPEVAAETARFVWGRLPGLPFLLASVALRSYLQSTGSTRPILLSVLVSNLVNVPANLLLIFGDPGLHGAGLPALGLPALGVVGSGLASSLATAAGLGVMLWDWRRSRPENAAEASLDVEAGTIVRLGWPIALQLLAEVGVFALAGVLIGRMGKAAAAGHTLAVTLASLSFSVALGVGAATGVRVGQAVGSGDREGARRAGLAGLLNTWLFMGSMAVVFFLAPDLVAGAMASQASTVVAAVPLLQVAALFQLSDGTQAVAAGALRGAGDTRASMIANLVGHYLVGLPVGIGLGLGMALGPTGVWLGLSAGLTAVAVRLLHRFFRLTSRPLARAEG